jgi:hypothetical protein
MTWLLERAAVADPEQRGNWRDASTLLVARAGRGFALV